MPKSRMYVILPNPFGVEPGTYEAVYDESLRQTFRAAPQLCQRVASPGVTVPRSRRQTLQKAAALQGRCWYCARVMNPLTIGAPDSIEMEHQIPRSSRHPAAERLENMVAACRACNNVAFPGKGELDVEGFRARLADHREVGRVVFFGEVLRWLRSHASALSLELPLSAAQAEQVLAWYRRSSGLELHTWGEAEADYAQALCIPVPADGLLFPLGVSARYWTGASQGQQPLARSA